MSADTTRLREEAPVPIQNPKAGCLNASTIFKYWLPGLFFWTWFFLRFLDLPLPFFEEASREVLLLYPAFAWIYSTAKSKWEILICPALIVFGTPVIFSFFLLKLLLFFLRLPMKIWNFAQTAQTTLVLILLVFFSLVVAVSVTNETTSAIAAITALVAYYVLSLQAFRWALKPFQPVLMMLEVGKSFIGWLINSSSKQPGVTPDSIKTWLEWARKATDHLDPTPPASGFKIAIVAKNQLVAASPIVFILLHLTIASVSAFALQRIEMAWGSLFTGLPAEPNFFDYFYVTLLSQASVIPAEILPIGFWGKFWLLLSVSTGVLLLGVLFALFSTAIGLQGEQAEEEIGNFFETFRNQLVSWEREHIGDIVQPHVIEAEIRES